MAFFTDTITVYNYYCDPDTDRDCWQRTVLDGVQWRDTVIQTVDAQGKARVDKSVSITVPTTCLANSPRRYVPATEFVKMDAEDREKAFTFNAVDNMDAIVCGLVTKEIEGKYRLSDLNKDYEHVATVKTVSDNRNRDFLKHIKVVAQ